MKIEITLTTEAAAELIEKFESGELAASGVSSMTIQTDGDNHADRLMAADRESSRSVLHDTNAIDSWRALQTGDRYPSRPEDYLYESRKAQYPEGTTHRGTVLEVNLLRVVIRLRGGVLGVVPHDKITRLHFSTPHDILRPGQRVNCKVSSISKSPPPYTLDFSSIRKFLRRRDPGHYFSRFEALVLLARGHLLNLLNRTYDPRIQGFPVMLTMVDVPQ